MRITSLVCLIAVTLASATLGAQTGTRLTVKELQELKSSSNDPGGDFFVDSPDRLRALLDAMAADSSRLSPMYLFLAANTAMRLGRVEDAAFFLYAGQIRAAFDFERYNIDARADGNNAATYLSFLKGTTGEVVNSAVQRQPKLFAAAVQRVETWDVVPADDAFYPEFEEAKGFKLPRAIWSARGRELKTDFLDKFGRRQATLLNDPEFFAAFKTIMDADPRQDDQKALARIEAAQDAMDAAEVRLFPGQPTMRQQMRAMEERIVREVASVTASPSRDDSPVAAAADAPLRVGGTVPLAKRIKDVAPVFPPGRRGSIVIELTIGPDGRVSKFNVLSGDFGLFTGAETAIRQWLFEPVMVDGRPVAVLQTVTLTAK